ncbi:MAG TPA: multicopper oxidase family protein [Planctomycetota bacterium]|nr:multicopper oxidase family protein [Planctomycetota bacterium]
MRPSRCHAWPSSASCLSLVVLFAWIPASGIAQRTHRVTLNPAAVPITIAPGKTVQNAWVYTGQLPGPTIRVTEGDRLQVKVLNDLPEATSVHWHGLPVPLAADGVPGVSQGAIGVGQEYDYDFVVTTPGTYWYHPHVDMQIDRGLVGAIIVDPKNSAADPRFDREYLLLVDDWLPGAPIPGRDPIYSDYLLNGKTSAGQTPLAVKQGEVVRLRVVNVSGATPYVFTVDGHSMRVTHADGQPVAPVIAGAIPIGPGERYDVYVDANHVGKWSIAFADLQNRSRTLVRAVLAYDGSNAPIPDASYVPIALASAPLLTYAQLKSASPRGSLFAQPSRTYDLQLGMRMMQYVWTINGQAFPNADPIFVSLQDRVRFRISNPTMMYHPMHLHGHFMLVHGSLGGTTAPLVKDTVLLPPGTMRSATRIDVDWLADNPGRWPFHCHQIYHMGAGMMRLVEYAGRDGDGDGLADGQDFDPHRGHAVTWTESGNYGIGTKVDFKAQWTPGQFSMWFVGAPLLQAVPFGLYGDSWIAPYIPLGASLVGVGGMSTLSFHLPNDAGLVGVRAGLQALTTTATLAPGLRLSTLSYLTIR